MAQSRSSSHSPPSPLTLPHAKLTRCAGRPDGISFASPWYRFTAIPGFQICVHCFESHIKGTPLARSCASFGIAPQPGHKAICHFNTERTHLFLKRGDLRALKIYAQNRARLTACFETTSAEEKHSLRWFGTPEVPRFAACEACFEDIILATPWARKFQFRELGDHPISVGAGGSCDVNKPYIKRVLKQCGDPSPWADFALAVNLRLAIAPCTESAVAPNTKRWLSPQTPAPINGLIMCEACWLDATGRLPSSDAFLERRIQQFEMKSVWTCSMQSHCLRAVTDEFIETDYKRWFKTIYQITWSPTCIGSGITDGVWYKLLHDRRSTNAEIVNFNICAACYMGLVQHSGHESWFSPREYPTGTVHVCDFCPESRRGHKYLQKWKQVVFTGNIRPLIEYTLKVSALLVCSQGLPLTNGEWWGMDGLCFCPACYEEVGRGSVFESAFTYRGHTLPLARCDMYTDRMRRRYVDACKAQNLDGLLAFALGRRHIREINEHLDALEGQSAHNGQANGHANGHANGYANGNTNGHANGHADSTVLTGTPGSIAMLTSKSNPAARGVSYHALPSPQGQAAMVCHSGAMSAGAYTPRLGNSVLRLDREALRSKWIEVE